MSHGFPPVIVDLIRAAYEKRGADDSAVLEDALEEHGFDLEVSILRDERSFLRDLYRDVCEHDSGQPERTWLATVWTCKKCGQMQGQT